MDELNDNERELLGLFRKLDRAGRRAVLSMAHFAEEYAKKK